MDSEPRKLYWQVRALSGDYELFGIAEAGLEAAARILAEHKSVSPRFIARYD